MGQLALGLRSLLFKAAVFFALAALLAWALGGTLFPRPSRVEYPGVEFAGAKWHLRLSVGGDRPGVARYELMRTVAKRDPAAVGSEFSETSDLVLTPDAIYVAMRRRPDEGGAWVVRRFDAEGAESSQEFADRLTVEEVLEARRQGR